MIFGYQIKLKDEEKERKGVVTASNMAEAVSDLTYYFKKEDNKVINCLILIPLSRDNDYDIFDFEDRLSSEEKEDSPDITVKVKTSIDAAPDLDELEGLKEILRNLEKLN